jgi:small-conductance mechanosensitive channel
MRISGSDVRRACDPRRIVWLGDQPLGRTTALDGTVVFGALAALCLAGLLFVGAPLSSVLLVAVGFAALIGIAAREYLADLASGALLRFVQPYEPGEVVRLFCAEQNDYVDAEVMHLGPVHTTLAGPDRQFRVPNHVMLSEPGAH